MILAWASPFNHRFALMLGHRLQCWPNIKPILDQLLVSLGSEHRSASKPGTSGTYAAAVTASPDRPIHNIHIYD